MPVWSDLDAVTVSRGEATYPPARVRAFGSRFSRRGRCSGAVGRVAKGSDVAEPSRTRPRKVVCLLSTLQKERKP